MLYAKGIMAPENICMIVGACAVLDKIAVQLHKPMEDDKVEELTDVDPYHGPQKGLNLGPYLSNNLVEIFNIYAVLTFCDPFFT